MARKLTQIASNQISNKDIKAKKVFKINDIDRTAYLKTNNRSFDKSFGSAQAAFTLHNPNGIFSVGGIYEINVGDVVSLTYEYGGDTVAYDCFYGKVNQRGILKNNQSNDITINCLDMISSLQEWDINLLIEGEKEEVENETLLPNLLSSPNEMYSQIFNFANDSLATDPLPVLMIRDKLHSLNEPQYDGFELYYSSGQVKFGFPLNVRDNYEVIAKSYYFYKTGVFVEDAIEQILTAPNGYGKYLYDEPSAQAVIDNHLTDNFTNVTGLTFDTLYPNFTASSVVLGAVLEENYDGASSPFLHYKLNDNANNSVIEDSSNNYEGATKDGTEPLLTNVATEVSGKIDRAIRTNNEGWHINCGDVSEINDARYLTMTFWFSPITIGGSGITEEYFFVKENGDGSTAFKIYTNSDDEFVIELRAKSTSYKAILSNYSTIVSVGTFSHFKISFDFTEEENINKIKLFIDNTQQTLTFDGAYVPRRIPNVSGYDLLIGNTSYSVNGYFDDIRMYKFAVSDTFYQAIYNGGNGTENAIAIGQLTVDTTEGFPTPESGETVECSINGDIFTYTSMDATHFYGIPTSGENSLSNHIAGSVIKLIDVKEAGKIWYLKYSNVITDLTTSDFTLPSGVTVEKFDKRYGRIYLSEAIPVGSVVTCDTNYSFKTLQASGIEINRIRFNSRDTENRFEAINQLRKYVAPNYIIRTQGDNKIWSSFLAQRSTADFELNLVSQLNYMEDTDLYTRVIMYSKNKNPTNIMFNDGVSFVTTDEEYKGYASLDDLVYLGEEGGEAIIPDSADETYSNWIKSRIESASEPTGYYLYATGIPNAGYITVENVQPTVYLDDVAIDNKKHQMILQPMRWEKTTRVVTTTTTSKKGADVKVETYYYYKLKFAHHSIDTTQDIILYDAYGEEQYRITAGDDGMDYGAGVYVVPGSEENEKIESLSTATYWVFYSTGNLVIDYNNAVFKIHKSLVEFPDETIVKATFEYIHTMTPVAGIAKVIDGRWDTQVQTEFYAEPPQGYNYGIIDLGQTTDIQAIDIVSGFYKPDEVLKMDTDITYTLQYSLDGTNYYNISDKTANVQITSGDTSSFEEDALGIGFQARYIKVVLENVKRIEYKKGIYPVAFTEISAYSDIVLKSEAKLIPTTYLTQATLEQSGEQTINVNSTKGFEEPESGEVASAFIDGEEFEYSGLTETSFTGCTGLVSSHSPLAYVYQYEETDTDIIDYDGLLQKIGDKLYKKIDINDETLYTQDENDRISKAYLSEFYKNHTKAQVDVMYSPHLLIGDTVRVVDSVNGIDGLYFIESISDNGGSTFNLTIGKYPS